MADGRDSRITSVQATAPPPLIDTTTIRTHLPWHAFGDRHATGDAADPARSRAHRRRCSSPRIWTKFKPGPIAFIRILALVLLGASGVAWALAVAAAAHHLRAAGAARRRHARRHARAAATTSAPRRAARRRDRRADRSVQRDAVRHPEARSAAAAAAGRPRAHRRRAHRRAPDEQRRNWSTARDTRDGGQPREERVPRQHEPRDPDADERHHRHDRPRARQRAHRRTSGTASPRCGRRPTRCCRS